MCARPLSLLVLSLCAVSACREPRTRPVQVQLRVEPSELVFGTLRPGETESRALRLSNASSASATFALRLSPAGSFSISTAEVHVPAGAAVDVQVRFEPDASGQHEASLEIVDGGVVVSLRGRAEQSPCPATTSPCRISSFNRDSGLCEEAAAADGTACQNACLREATCAGGECVGTAVQCSDQDPCTDDACNPVSGCISVPTQCPAPEDPCAVAACDPVRGCVSAPVADGTPCGANNCRSASVCIAGECRAFPVGEGAACTTPCGTGTCSGGTCVTPTTKLNPAWTVQVAPSSNWLQFPGVTDGAGNLYWFECASSASDCDLVSSTGSGVPRYRVPGSSARYVDRAGAGSELVQVAGMLIWADSEALTAFHTATGAVAWRKRFSEVFGTDCRIDPGGLSSSGPDRIELTAAVLCFGNGGTSQHLAQLEAPSGALVWRTSRAANEACAGRAFPAGTSLLWPRVSWQHVLERVTIHGIYEEDAVPVMEGHLVAANAALLITQNGSVYRRADGARIRALDYPVSSGVASRERFVVTSFSAVLGLDGTDGAQVWRIEGTAGPPLLTGVGTAIIAGGYNKSPVELREVDLVDGHTLWACTVPAPATEKYLLAYATLTDGYWVVPTSSLEEHGRVEAFRVDRSLSPTGWTKMRVDARATGRLP